MAKIANEYYKIHPWKIIEEEYDQKQNKISESIFSIGNEYMGVRGFIEEGVSAPSLLGSYFNGIYEWNPEETGLHYKGIVNRTHWMVNAVNWLYTRISIDHEQLDLAKIRYEDFTRELDLKTGELKRKFIWVLRDKKRIALSFGRLIDMKNVIYGHQRITIKPLNFSGKINVIIGLDFSIKHWGKFDMWQVDQMNLKQRILVGRTASKQMVASGYKLYGKFRGKSKIAYKDRLLTETLTLNVKENETTIIEKRIANIIDKNQAEDQKTILNQLHAKLLAVPSYQSSLQSNEMFFERVAHENDIEIIGDDKNQQGIRFCLFQLTQTYHGADETNNIGAKGLTGEAYSGHAFWDTETYCLPFYIFSNPNAAKNLLMFRYHTLPQARQRALDVDCQGACYPIATLNGYESCDLWQHASLQPQPSSAVAYAIWHYVKITNDVTFMLDYGLEMILEISRYLKSRGDWNSTHTHFGWYGVMGPDEFQMMVSHDTYTNFIGKEILKLAVATIRKLQKIDPEKVKAVREKINFSNDEIKEYQNIIKHIKLLYNDETKLFEQHAGYYDLPHIDIHKIPVTNFPLYANWSYDRIFRNDMIKQPAVLMLMFLFNQQFSLAQKKANYLFYEPRTIHESSLSPSIHSVIAAEIGKMKEAVNLFGFATRMDLDDYNRNTSEGLHMTSIAAAWVNIVYGFGGMRSDGEVLLFKPQIPKTWTYYSFKVRYHNAIIKVSVSKKETIFELDNNLDVPVVIYGKSVKLMKGKQSFHE